MHRVTIDRIQIPEKQYINLAIDCINPIINYVNDIPSLTT